MIITLAFPFHNEANENQAIRKLTILGDFIRPTPPRVIQLVNLLPTSDPRTMKRRKTRVLSLERLVCFVCLFSRNSTGCVSGQKLLDFGTYRVTVVSGGGIGSRIEGQ